MPTQTTLGTSPNGLLACLSSADQDLLAPFLRPVQLRLRQRLEQANRRLRAVYFIERGMASMVAVGGADRRQAEVSLIGREGVTGIALILGLEHAPHDTFVQTEGCAQCVSAADLQHLLACSRTLHAVLLRYAHVANVTIAHTALANARASIEERLARWLLMAHDRSENDEIYLTHELLALMLGSRRAGVTTALNAFDARGWISHARARITIIDRGGLRQHASGLYGVPEAEYRRAFDNVPTA